VTDYSRVLGDCCPKCPPLTAPVVHPYQVKQVGDYQVRAEYRCACGNDWSCWWDARYVGWSADLAGRDEDTGSAA
jgi:hypothetical protein